MSNNDYIDEGNEPVQNIIEERNVTIAGVNTNVKFTDNGEVLVEQPEMSEQEFEQWQGKAKNEIKALKISNERNVESKHINVENKVIKKQVDEKMSAFETRIQEQSEMIKTLLSKIENGNIQKATVQDTDLFGYHSKEELNDALVDNPDIVLNSLKKSVDKDVEKAVRRFSLQSTIESEGYNFNEVKQFANSLNADISPQIFDTYKRLQDKRPKTSKFDDINKIQESSIKFVKGNRSTAQTEPDDIFTKMSKSAQKGSLNKI